MSGMNAETGQNYSTFELLCNLALKHGNTQPIDKIFDAYANNPNLIAPTENNRQEMWKMTNEMCQFVPRDENIVKDKNQIIFRANIKANFDYLTKMLSKNISCKELTDIDIQKLLLAKDINNAYYYDLEPTLKVLNLGFKQTMYANKALDFVLEEVILPKINKDENYFQKVSVENLTTIVNMFNEQNNIQKLSGIQQHKIREYFMQPLHETIYNIKQKEGRTDFERQALCNRCLNFVTIRL
jgi:hypothetical protein